MGDLYLLLGDARLKQILRMAGEWNPTEMVKHPKENMKQGYTLAGGGAGTISVYGRVAGEQTTFTSSLWGRGSDTPARVQSVKGKTAETEAPRSSVDSPTKYLRGGRSSTTSAPTP